MDYRSFFHPAISAAKYHAPDLLGSEEEDGDPYAELWQQILQLTSDSDDNPVGPTIQQRPFPVAAPSPATCPDWQVTNRNVEPSPAWWLSLPRSRSGTGVFIPSIAATERGGHQGRAARRKKKAAKKQAENK